MKKIDFYTSCMLVRCSSRSEIFPCPSVLIFLSFRPELARPISFSLCSCCRCFHFPIQFPSFHYSSCFLCDRSDLALPVLRCYRLHFSCSESYCRAASFRIRSWSFHRPDPTAVVLLLRFFLPPLVLSRRAPSLLLSWVVFPASSFQHRQMPPSPRFLVKIHFPLCSAAWFFCSCPWAFFLLRSRAARFSSGLPARTQEDWLHFSHEFLFWFSSCSSSYVAQACSVFFWDWFFCLLTHRLVFF
jgi:hypothetical protein